MTAVQRLTTLLVLGVVLSFVTTSGALAITNGQPDGERHPFVGLIIFDAPNADGQIVPAWRCSGTLLSPTLVLTAGHCTDGATAARAFFDSDLTNNTEYPFGGATSYEGTPVTYPGFGVGTGSGLPRFATYDVGVVVLSEPVPSGVISSYGLLPAAGLVDTLSKGTEVDLVGYGVQFKVGTGVPPFDRWRGLRIRLFAPAELVSGRFVHSDMFIRLTANPAQGKGGTCFGDSGGADFLAGTRTILAVNSYVTNANCAGVTYSQRVDLAEVLTWIRSFM